MVLPIEVKKRAAKMLARGTSIRETANAIGSSPTSVVKWRTQEQMRSWIEAEHQRYISAIPTAIDHSHKILAKAKETEVTTENAKIHELAQRESERMYQATGILPARST